jgi:hypothetical protein
MVVYDRSENVRQRKDSIHPPADPENARVRELGRGRSRECASSRLVETEKTHYDLRYKREGKSDWRLMKNTEKQREDTDNNERGKRYTLVQDEPYCNKEERVLAEFWVSLSRTTLFNTSHSFIS